jgi:hypothetical protein
MKSALEHRRTQSILLQSPLELKVDSGSEVRVRGQARGLAAGSWRQLDRGGSWPGLGKHEKDGEVEIPRQPGHLKQRSYLQETTHARACPAARSRSVRNASPRKDPGPKMGCSPNRCRKEFERRGGMNLAASYEPSASLSRNQVLMGARIQKGGGNPLPVFHWCTSRPSPSALAPLSEGPSSGKGRKRRAGGGGARWRRL